MKSIDKFVWHIRSSDGLKLYGDVYAQRSDARKWALVAHGYNSKAALMESFVEQFVYEGFNVLAIDLRGHGRSEGEYFGMGYPDAGDILLWIKKITERDPLAEIVLFGTSMGGAAVLCTSSMPLPTNVMGIISDSSYTSAWAEFRHQIKNRYKVPASWLLLPANAVTKLRAGYYITDVSPLKAVKLSKTPILFIHGNADDYVPFDMQQELFDAANCEKYKLTVPNAAHVASSAEEPGLYWDAVREFLVKSGLS